MEIKHRLSLSQSVGWTDVREAQPRFFSPNPADIAHPPTERITKFCIITHENHLMRWIQIAILLQALGFAAIAQVTQMNYATSPAMGLGPTSGVMRRDPSDIIQVGDIYYIWYSKGAVNSGYDATIWYATSADGHTWTEMGEALNRGPKGSWEEQSVFTPNILVAKGRYWLFYTAVPKPFVNSGPKITKTAIGIAVSDSPNGVV